MGPDVLDFISKIRKSKTQKLRENGWKRQGAENPQCGSIEMQGVPNY